MLESVVGCVRLSERDGGENTMWREMQQQVHQKQRCCLLHHLKKNWQTVRETVAHRFVALEKGVDGMTRQTLNKTRQAMFQAFSDTVGHLILFRFHELSLRDDPAKMTKQPAVGTFQSLLASANLPPPGPEHFAARRALWITPTAASRLDQTTSASPVELESPLKIPGALESSEVWDTGLVSLRAMVCLRPRPGLSPHFWSSLLVFRLRSYLLAGVEMELGQIMLQSLTRTIFLARWTIP